mmetsp:Transcript_28216/g.45354  ORF Transcript_28216/g.45354 Transcript_28216/m.45354 type:complete len:257 (-) Transcript_28216:1552-2322(-)
MIVAQRARIVRLQQHVVTGHSAQGRALGFPPFLKSSSTTISKHPLLTTKHGTPAHVQAFILTSQYRVRSAGMRTFWPAPNQYSPLGQNRAGGWGLTCIGMLRARTVWHPSTRHIFSRTSPNTVAAACDRLVCSMSPSILQLRVDHCLHWDPKVSAGTGTHRVLVARPPCGHTLHNAPHCLTLCKPPQPVGALDNTTTPRTSPQSSSFELEVSFGQLRLMGSVHGGLRDTVASLQPNTCIHKHSELNIIGAYLCMPG